jgi:hypothetical protein
MLERGLVIFGFIWICSIAGAQSLERLDIPFLYGGKNIQYATTGGVNNVQFSQGDLNFDGTPDLILFDRNGDVFIPFLYNTKIGRYDFTPSIVKNFPRVRDWVIMKDFNKDGIIDIFSSSFNTQGPAGIEVYKGFRSGNELKFNIVNTYNFINILMWPTGGNKFTQIPVDYTDLPTIEDIDSDGDLDILVFSPGGTRVEFYKNIAIERGWSLDSLKYVLEDNCYGNFSEGGFTSDIFLSGSPDTCASGLIKNSNAKRHSGSTLLTLDLNGDQLQDLLVGDLSNPHLVALYNGGTKTNAWMNLQDKTWPSENIPVDMVIFNGAFEVDVNLDGNKDVVVAPNQRFLALNTNNIHYYRKFIDNGKIKFNLESKKFLVDEMLDFGASAFPCFVDYNQDGLLDLLVGTEGIFLQGNTLEASMVLFENKGTKNNPEFHLVDSNYLNFKRFSTGQNPSYNFAPTFGDLDGDGDLDMLVGEYNGSFFYCENIAGPGNKFNFKNPVYAFQNLEVKGFSAPCLVDLNRDGLLDIVVGSLTSNNNSNFEPCGSFYYFQNQGSKTSPFFNPDPNLLPNTQCLGGVIMDGIGSKVNSSPVVFDFEGKYKLFAGGFLGRTLVCGDIETNIYNDFKIEFTDYGNLREGEKTHLSIADIDNDGVLEMAVGNQRGGFAIFKTTYLTNGNQVSNKDLDKTEFFIYPNPANDFIICELEQFMDGTISIYDIQGKLKRMDAFKNQKFIQVNISLTPGLYMVKLTSHNVQKFKSLIIK